VLRYGGFYGPGTAISLAPDAQVAAPIRKRRFPIIGDGGGVTSHIHIDDAAAATVAAVDHGQPPSPRSCMPPEAWLLHIASGGRNVARWCQLGRTSVRLRRQ
jgi:nucleoside-diphosphate-sugar epimerase